MKLLLSLLLLIGTLHAEDNAPEEEEYSKDFLFFLLAPEIERQIGRPFESSEEWNRYKKFATEECTKKKNHQEIHRNGAEDKESLKNLALKNGWNTDNI